MAADSASVNGMYDGQYSQPAELAASTPSHQASTSQTASNTMQKADPQEIGWYFVEQYYTTLSKTPERIHLFYNKKSQLTTGKEAEKVLPAVGSKNISEKIRTLDFQDCKVRVLNVDCQSSFENIVVQVIGELSNKGQPHERFVQTFVLATQPNGYFVLNDIFRYFDVDEQDPEIVEDEAKEADVGTEATAPKTDSVPESAADEAQTVESEAVAEQVDEKLEAVKDESAAAEAEVNGTDEEKESGVEPAVEPVAAAPVAEADESAVPVEEKPKDPEPTPAVTPPKPTSTPAAEAAPVKKTWASLVGTKASSMVPAVPQTAAAAAAPAPAQSKVQRPAAQAPAVKTPTEASADTPSQVNSAGSPTNGWQTAESSKKARGQQGKGPEGIVHAYIRNVNDKIDARELREVLESFGSLKYFDVARPKQCAFIEFQDAAGYAAAVSANPHTVSGESIVVEERRLRSGQSGPFNNQYGRGGATAGRGRGGAPREGGRGGLSGRGNKTGTVAARGRGSTPAA